MADLKNKLEEAQTKEEKRILETKIEELKFHIMLDNPKRRKRWLQRRR